MAGNSGVVFWGILLLVFVLLAFSGVVFWIFFLIGEVEKEREKTNKERKIQEDEKCKPGK